MKKAFSYFALLTILSGTVLFSCKKEDVVALAPAGPAFSQSGIAGTWKIIVSQGVEWEQGVGIITPLAAEPDLLNAKLVIVGTEATLTAADGTVFGSFPIAADATGMTVTLDGVGLFNVSEYVGGVSMQWIQREPIAADYEENNPGQFLYFQKYWTLQKTL